jgi:hypothetical protein
MLVGGNKPKYVFTETSVVGPDRALGNGVSKIVKKKIPVDNDKVDLASKIVPNNGDSGTTIHISDKQIKDFLRKTEVLKDPEKFDVDSNAIVSSFKDDLAGRPSGVKDAYRSYDQVISDFQALQNKYPNRLKVDFLKDAEGNNIKTAEGRQIPLLIISENINSDDIKNKPAVYIDALTHAREWGGGEAVRYTAEKLVTDEDEKSKNRRNSALIYVVPIANPDGYEHSRNSDSFWRKNREPIHASDISPALAKEMGVNGNEVIDIGVDPNRNYGKKGDKSLEKIWRPDGDSPDSTYDDYSATSDDPHDDTFRGTGPGSTKEVEGGMNLWYGNKQVKGILHYHNYGGEILYPYAISNKEHVKNEAIYKEAGGRMHDAISSKGSNYRVHQSSELYPTSGDPDDVGYVDGKISMTVEAGRNFQPGKTEVQKLREELYEGNKAFIDWVVEKNPKTEVPPKTDSFSMPGNLDI